MHRGFTKRWRKRWDKGTHKDHLLWVLMDYFIDFANHADSEVYFKGVGMIPLKRGQHVFGTQKLADFMGAARSLIRRKLKILETIGFSTIKTTNKYSILTVLNYDLYQSPLKENDQQNDQQAANKRPTNGQQTATPKKNKNNKNIKNEEEVISTLTGTRQQNGVLVDKKMIPNCPHNAIIKLYHKYLPALPQVKLWDDTSKRHLKARWRENPERQTLEFWQYFFQYVGQSDFLLGNKMDFQANLQWIIKPTNFAKIINGSYHRNQTFHKRLQGIKEKWLQKYDQERKDS